jgi:hypothetical protein
MRIDILCTGSTRHLTQNSLRYRGGPHDDVSRALDPNAESRDQPVALVRQRAESLRLEFRSHARHLGDTAIGQLDIDDVSMLLFH